MCFFFRIPQSHVICFESVRLQHIAYTYNSRQMTWINETYNSNAHLRVLLVCKFAQSLEPRNNKRQAVDGTWVPTAGWQTDWPWSASSTWCEASRRLKPVCTMSVYTTLNRPWSHASTKLPPSPVQKLYCFLTRVFVSATWHCIIKRQCPSKIEWSMFLVHGSMSEKYCAVGRDVSLFSLGWCLRYLISDV
jgi:hypothetical protein